MKNYLDLIPISANVHKKQNRMSIFCIILAVFLVTTIFGMADMFIRCQFRQAQMDDGNWHIGIRYINDEDARLISARPEIKNFACYGVLNYGLDMGYTLYDRNVIICGSDESYLTEMEADAITEGSFPKTEQEILVSEYARDMLHLNIGDTVAIHDSNETRYQYTISGFGKNTIKNTQEDVYYVFLTTEAFRAIFPSVTKGPADAYDSMYLVQFANHGKIQKTIADIKSQFNLSDEQITENAKVLALLGQSGNNFIMQIYGVAAVLSILVLLAGILMIASSLNSNIAGRTEFFGMLRCIGATPRQIMRLVRREALSLCGFAIPISVVAGMAVIWILCAVLRYLSPKYFGAMSAFGVSLPSIAAGICIGILTVLLAARSPAKRAAKVSPLTAVTGNANNLQPVRKAANTAFFKVDTALGIHHAKGARKNFLLVSGSFSLSIILFLSFSVTIDFMKHAINPLYPWTPDLSIVSPDNTCSVDNALFEALQENPSVKKVYGRRFAYNIPALINDKANTADIISYEEAQFEWAKEYKIEGSLEEVQTRRYTGLVVFTPQYGQQTTIQAGDIVTLDIDGQPAEVEIVGMISKCPFDSAAGSEIIICSEDTFQALTGQSDYTILDIQLTRNATDNDVNAIHAAAGTGYTFSDRRMNNDSVRGASYAFRLFLYGFLTLIGLITIFNIINCMSMNVIARMKQYGALRAIGLSNRQLSKMIIAQTLTYVFAGSVCGGVLGLTLNKILFEKLVTFRWGDHWKIPATELGIIAAIVVVSVVLAVWSPLKKIGKLSIVDTISAQ